MKATSNKAATVAVTESAPTALVFTDAQLAEAKAIGGRMAQAESVIGQSIKEFKAMIGPATNELHKARLAAFRVQFEAGHKEKSGSEQAAKMAFSRLINAAGFEALSKRGRPRRATDTAGKPEPKATRKAKTTNLLAEPRDAVIGKVRGLATTKGITATLAERNAATLHGIANHWDKVVAYALRLERAAAKSRTTGKVKAKRK